jgi:gluconate 2-dehydrogenase gamma chain
MRDEEQPSPRRTFLFQAVTLAGAGALASPAVATGAAGAREPTAAPSGGASSAPYQSLSPDEATFVEALVNFMCPADGYSPNGVDCGLATYIDRQIAGPFGKGDGRYQRGPFRTGKPELGPQSPLSPEQIFKSGIAAANSACLRQYGRSFDRLAAADADAFLKSVRAGTVQAEGAPLANWFNDIVYPLFVEACFADPMYGGNRDAVFWKMIGYPGLPATHTLDMVRYRGQPYPGAKAPKSIGDFT